MTLNLFSTITSSKKFDFRIVRQLLANLSEDFGIYSSPIFGVSRIREKLSITHGSINAHYGIDIRVIVPEEPEMNKVVVCITDNERTHWVDRHMSSTYLSTKYSLLYGISIKN